MTDLVHFDVDSTTTGPIATLEIDSPHNRNALSRALLADLAWALSAAANNPTLHGVLITSSGAVFSSGADLTEAHTHGMLDSSTAIMAIQRQIAALHVPVVARVDGAVRAGGIGILAACDIVIAAESATFAFTEARLGLAPAAVSATVVPVMTRRSAAMAFLTARVFDGRSAQEWGLVTTAIPAGEVGEEVDRVLRDISACNRQGLRESKALLSAPVLQRIDDFGFDLVATSADLFASEGARRAMAAFLR